MKDFLYRIVTDDVHGPLAGILKFFLRILSFIYLALVTAAAWLYRSGILKQHHLGRPVVSVGNITVGGTGKTPLVVKIAQIYKENKIKPVILTRGYMGRGIACDPAQSAQSDEAVMMREILGDVPVISGADRIKNARDFLKNNQADVFILDDGFQQWRLARDLDIVAIDTTNPFGNGCLLPRGILREPLAALRRANLLILTKVDLGREQMDLIRKRLAAIGCTQQLIETVHRPVRLVDLKTGRSREMETIAGQRVCAVCSLGAPAAFAATLTGLGAKIQKAFNFADHYVYNTADIRRILEHCRRDHIGIVITTQKDAVKLADLRDDIRQVEDVEFQSLHIELTVRDGTGENAFFKRILDTSTAKGGA
ncbi:MAG: tetraacyldisaccharide 4'-kinase [Candidatus Omnitrophica bacterium]|nr:tetraacyldisaccharide 4'-kinase [Candidatus Omnitrophota bacterium]